MPAFFLYARKSSEEDNRQIASIGAQVAELQDLARARGLVIGRVFEESQSARKVGRPIFAEMMREVDRHGTAGILCWKPDRLARNAVDGGRVIDAMDREVVGEIVTPGRSFRNTAEDKLMLGLEFSMSKKYVDDLSDNVKRGNRAVLNSGRVPGVVPIGYLKAPTIDRTRGRGAGKAIPDPVRFPLVVEMFKRAATGRYTTSEIYRMAATELGLHTRGNRAYPGALVSITTVWIMLSNPFYMGLIRRDGDVYQGDHIPAVSREDFERVQKFLHRSDRHRPSVRTFTYRGMLGCECGRGVTAEMHTKSTGISYVYYRCTRRQTNLAVCARPFLAESKLEREIAAILRDLEVPERFLKWGLRRIDAWEKRGVTVARAARESLTKELAQKEREIERLTTLCLREAISEDEFVQTKTKLLADKGELAARLADPAPEATVARKLREIIVVAAGASNVFQNGDAEERRKLVARMFDRVSLQVDGVRLDLALPFLILAGRASKSDSASKGSNSTMPLQITNESGRKRTTATVPERSHRQLPCPTGSNSLGTTDPSLNERKNRVVAGAKQTRFLTWCRGPGLNWRRKDFQSFALPLSYHGKMRQMIRKTRRFGKREPKYPLFPPPFGIPSFL